MEKRLQSQDRLTYSKLLISMNLLTRWVDFVKLSVIMRNLTLIFGWDVETFSKYYKVIVHRPLTVLELYFADILIYFRWRFSEQHFVLRADWRLLCNICWREILSILLIQSIEIYREVTNAPLMLFRWLLIV